MELEFTPFYQRIQDFIIGGTSHYSAMTPGALGVKQYVNLPWATLGGLDLLYMASITSNLRWVANLKYTRAADDAGAPLPLIPPLKAVNALRYENARLNASIEWECADSQRRVSAIAGENPTPGWPILSLRTGWKVNSLLRCSAGVENLLDNNYHEHLDIGDVPRPGRNMYLNVTYRF
jgi:iron complex outermembrane receptor protein